MATEKPRRWGRVVDVVADGVIYTEDAERLVLAGIRWPEKAEARAQAEAVLTDMVSDKIVFYESLGTDSLGRVLAEVWVNGAHVNAALRARGYT